MSFVTIFTVLLAGVAAWGLVAMAKGRLLYDMHNIPGPRAWPLIGNLGEILGTAHLHKVHWRRSPSADEL